MNLSESVVFAQGGFRRYDDARVGLLTHGLNYGTGIFEGIRAYWSEQREQLYVLRMPEHFERMKNNARTLQMHIPHSVAEL